MGIREPFVGKPLQSLQSPGKNTLAKAPEHREASAATELGIRKAA
jgi:hypothetical protein